MKINLVNLEEGVNELRLQTTALNCGLSEEIDLERLNTFAHDIQLEIEVQKFSDKYFVKVRFLTPANFVCDRCLVDFVTNIEGSFRLVFSKQQATDQPDDDYRYLSENATEIDLSADLRENLLLAIPMKALCHDECRGLCPHCGANLNEETCGCQQQQIDPRWEKLTSLLR